MTTNQDDQQQRHQATMTMLEKMGQLADELMEEREEQQRLEDEWQARRCKPVEPDDKPEEENQ